MVVKGVHFLFLKVLAVMEVAVMVVVVPTVTGTMVIVGPPIGPAPESYQSNRFGDH